nr:hypothetical protein [Dictyobacter kobayashii]
MHTNAAPDPEDRRHAFRSFVHSNAEAFDQPMVERPPVNMRPPAAVSDQELAVPGAGILDIVEDGYGFLRSERYLSGPQDIYVSHSQIRRFGLRQGDFVAGQVRPPKEREQYGGLLRVEQVNGRGAEAVSMRPRFESLTPIFPQEMFDLESDPTNLSGRLMNLVSRWAVVSVA